VKKEKIENPEKSYIPGYHLSVNCSSPLSVKNEVIVPQSEKRLTFSRLEQAAMIWNKV
jgi:hypothetical protein